MNGSNAFSIKVVRGTINLKEGRESAILALQPVPDRGIRIYPPKILNINS
jgi:hypothetical protein